MIFLDKLLLTLFFSSFSVADSNLLNTTYSFKDLSVNYLDWTTKTEKASFQVASDTRDYNRNPIPICAQ